MKPLRALPLLALALPLSAQAWDLRWEAPFPQGQNLPQTLLQGTGELVYGGLKTGNGFILTAEHRIIRVGPVLKLEWGVEFSKLQADGQIQQGTATFASQLRQSGVGVGLNAQFWVPFTGFAGEMGVIERFHSYKYEGGGAAQDTNITRPWLRMGIRWNIPSPGISPYLAASYQQPITKDDPVQVHSAADLATYLLAQGPGQEFQRLWTFGVGITF